MADPTRPGKLPIAIIGAGFSGTLLAINLLRQGASVVLVERDGARLAKGLAFSTRGPEHLLNVRASNMSAFPDDQGHFLRWMGYSTGEEANRFAPRLGYGQYLHELLIDALAAAPGRALVREGEAVSARFDADGVELRLAGGDALACSALVLALGNFPPSPHPVLAALPNDVHFADPWRPDVNKRLDDVDHILLLGSGLTSVDVILSLERAGFRGRYTAMSRRGLKPRSHALVGPVVKPGSEIRERGAWLVRAVRKRAGAVGWRSAIDELRAHTQNLWRRHDQRAQRSFLRHLRPFWDVHRHRLAPAVADQIASLEAAGRLCFVAGKLTGADAFEHGARIAWRARGEDIVQSMRVGRIINCVGPEGDLRRSDDLLVRDLLAQGYIRPDVHGLGLDVTHSGRVRDATGATHRQLFAVGPITKGEAWEIVAVPDIRRQVWNLARYLGDAHWIGGEGL